MKRLIIFSLILATAGLFSCKQKQSELLNKDSFESFNNPNKQLFYEVNLKDSLLPEWLSSLDSEKMVNFYMNAIFDGKITPYFSVNPGGFAPTTIDKVREMMDLKEGERNFSEIKRIIFVENWKMNKENISFKKDVIGMCFVRVFKQNISDSESQERKMIICYIFFDTVPSISPYDI
jgi:hypothetical protein